MHGNMARPATSQYKNTNNLLQQNSVQDLRPKEHQRSQQHLNMIQKQLAQKQSVKVLPGQSGYSKPQSSQQIGTPKSIYEATNLKPQYKPSLTNTIN